MNKTKRQKSRNFSDGEVEYLMTLVQRNWKVLGNKKIDAVSSNEKAQFNSQVRDCYRNEKVLKTKFENICRTAATKSSEMKKSIKSTGGGPGSSCMLSSIDEIALTLLGTRATGLTDTYCEDSVNDEGEEEIDNDLEEYEEIIDVDVIGTDSDAAYSSQIINDENVVDWDGLTAEVKKKVCQALCDSTKSQIRNINNGTKISFGCYKQ